MRLIVFLFALFTTTSSAQTLDPFAWLKGCWRTQGDGPVITEVWLAPPVPAMLGYSYTVGDGETRGWEQMRIERTDDGAYFVAMPGVDEMHLLNLTVAPEWQRQGHACRLLDELEARCRSLGVPTLWLEVRAGNDRARQVYERRGFVEVGRRPRYYPAARGLREDAVVMRLPVAAAEGRS